MMTVFLILLMSFLSILNDVFIVWALPLLLAVTSLYVGEIFVPFMSYGFLGFDFFSVFLIFISIWVFYYCCSCILNDLKSLYYLLLMFVFLILSFSFDNYFLFYVFFELVFLLMFVFLLSWGKTQERLQASFYMFFYTLIFSLPFFIFMVYCMTSLSSMSFLSFNFSNYSGNWMKLFIIMVFIVKLPLYSVHLWLPKAHVEAPVVGSMILAGILLKLGAYGLFRFISFFSFSSFYMSFMFSGLFYLSLYGGLLVALVCLRQSDLKIIIAYSSIVHMSFMMVGMLSFSDVGLYGALLMLVAHGFISPFMFFGLNFIYENFHSRSVFTLKGMILILPLFCFLWFLGIILNTGFPPFMSFFSEVMISMSMSMISCLDFFMILVFFFLCGAYNMYLYVIPSHGGIKFLTYMKSDFKMIFLSFSHFYFVLVFPLLSL
uniref:NADH-ubiquinone oxidoreductase chain 4 n=1 Tax=Psoroptes ovis TaxID=83912 RepID=A0A075X730_PSOOV|nr:NADH dehydrogenase subunit 4 [Psoroptes ovis]AIH15207.1 NADH dehydrogenase subunit 4 [Psoroptes ovis]